MQLGTFAAVFEAALTLEEHLKSRYEAQRSVYPVYAVLAKGCSKRLNRLERTRRETVTEMIIVPIHDLFLSDELVALGEVDPATPLSPAAAIALEEQARRFYEDAAAKIGQDEAARALQRMAKDNARRIAQLQER